MAKAKPVTQEPEAEVATTEAEVATTAAAAAADPRRPQLEAEHTGSKPKVVTKLDNGTVIEDY